MDNVCKIKVKLSGINFVVGVCNENATARMMHSICIYIE